MGSMFLATSFPRDGHAPSSDLPLSKVDFVKISLRSELFIVLNIKVFLCHSVLRCWGGLCVCEKRRF